MIGTRLSILGGQVQITAVGSATPITTATVTVLSALPVAIAFTVSSITPFAIGDIVETVNTGLELEVYGVGGSSMQAVLMNQRSVANLATTVGDTIYSVNGNSVISGAAFITSTVTTTIQWSEEFMSAYAGWPSAVSEGNDRLIFCQFPQRQEAILWTVIGQPTQCYIDSAAAVANTSAGASATSGILEFIDGRPKVLNVVDTGDEFVFTDHGVWFIPLAVAGTRSSPARLPSGRSQTTDARPSVRCRSCKRSSMPTRPATEFLSCARPARTPCPIRVTT